MKKYKIVYQDKDIKELVVCTQNIEKEKLPKNIISIKQINSKKINFYKKIITDKELQKILKELVIILDSNIEFSKALSILIAKEKNKKQKEFLKEVEYVFKNSLNLNNLKKQFKVNFLFLSFLQVAQESGNLKENIKSLYLLLEEMSLIKKQFMKALYYPIFLLISLIFTFMMIFIFVVPKFILIFENVQGKIPLATKLLFSFYFFFQNYFYFCIFLILIIFVIFVSLYYKSNVFNLFINKILFKYLSFYRYMYLYRLFLSLHLLSQSKYEFHKAFNFSKALIKNKYLLDKMSLINSLLLNGKSINDSFSYTKIFDDLVLSLVYIGEVSNSMEKSLFEIKKIYKDRFTEKSKVIILAIEPIFLIVIVFFILWIVFAIFMPLWDIGNIIKM